MGYRISLITSSLNRQRGLETLYHSIKPYLGEIEWIVVNDGSNDSTADFLADINSDSVIKINNLTNKGLGYSRNLAIKKMRSPYFMNVDSDNLPTLEFLRGFADLLGNNIVKMNVFYKSGKISRGEKLRKGFYRTDEWLRCSRDIEFVTIVRKDFWKANNMMFCQTVNGCEGATWNKLISLNGGVQLCSIKAQKYDDLSESRLSNRWSNINRIRKCHIYDIGLNWRSYVSHNKVNIITLILKIITYNVYYILQKGLQFFIQLKGRSNLFKG